MVFFCLAVLTGCRVISNAGFARFAGALLVSALPELRCFSLIV